jgi:GxxExxY protein
MTRKEPEKASGPSDSTGGVERRDEAKAGQSYKGYDFDDATGAVIGACIEVHRTLGPGFREITYQRALRLELQAKGLDFSREESIPIYYKGKKIDTRRVDFIVDDCLVEIRAKSEMDPEDHVQALSYLKASGYQVGLLVNFGTRRAEFKRLVDTRAGDDA